MTQPTIEPAPLCSHCGFTLPKHDGGLRHYGTHIAHQENECLRLLHAEIARLRAALTAQMLPEGWEIKSVLVRVKKDGERNIEMFSNSYVNAIKSVNAAIAAENDGAG